MEINRGNPVSTEGSEAQMRTLLDERKVKVLAKCQARISQHEFQAARAEEDQRLLQGQLWHQKLEFREAHQRSLTEMEELRKFQSSAFDTARAWRPAGRKTRFGDVWLSLAMYKWVKTGSC